jgi:hypothetical protein
MGKRKNKIGTLLRIKGSNGKRKEDAMKYAALFLMVSLLIAANATAEASSIKISVAYAKSDHQACKQATCSAQHYKLEHFDAKKVMYIGTQPQRYRTTYWYNAPYRYSYYPQQQYCQVFWDSKGRKLRKCTFSSEELKDYCHVCRSYYKANYYGHDCSYCWYK